ncbi:MAG: addiction module protein [Phycisphaerales bacterium]|nr:addiction module protein [Phycisphaerales bacterium]
MKPKVKISDLLTLNVAERIRLVEDLWDSIANVPEAVKLTEVQRAELDARLEAHRKNPDAVSPWNLVKARISRRS